jgi:uncharacterized paraquat-inducible protein A
MSRSRKERDREILKQMLDDGPEPAGRPVAAGPETPASDPADDPDDAVRCPRCNARLADRKSGCPRCGYQGYVPMSKAETARIRRILFPVLLAVAAAVFLLFRFVL